MLLLIPFHTTLVVPVSDKQLSVPPHPLALAFPWYKVTEFIVLGLFVFSPVNWAQDGALWPFALWSSTVHYRWSCWCWDVACLNIPGHLVECCVGDRDHMINDGLDVSLYPNSTFDLHPSCCVLVTQMYAFSITVLCKWCLVYWCLWWLLSLLFVNRNVWMWLRRMYQYPLG